MSTGLQGLCNLSVHVGIPALQNHVPYLGRVSSKAAVVRMVVEPQFTLCRCASLATRIDDATLDERQEGRRLCSSDVATCT